MGGDRPSRGEVGPDMLTYDVVYPPTQRSLTPEFITWFSDRFHSLTRAHTTSDPPTDPPSSCKSYGFLLVSADRLLTPLYTTYFTPLMDAAPPLLGLHSNRHTTSGQVCPHARSAMYLTSHGVQVLLISATYP